MFLSKRDLFSAAGVFLLGINHRPYNYRDPMDDLRCWADRVPWKFRAIKFRLVKGDRIYSIMEYDAKLALEQFDEIILVEAQYDELDGPAWRAEFSKWWHNI